MPCHIQQTYSCEWNIVISEEKPQKVSSSVVGTKKSQNHCTLVVSGAEGEELSQKLVTVLTQLKNQVTVQVPGPERDDGAALVRFKSKQDALKACRKLAQTKIAGL